MKVKFAELKHSFPNWEFQNIDLEDEIFQVNHDTRTLQPGEFYLPIVGENHDGHKFIDAAFKSGAIASFCERSKLHTVTTGKSALIVVDSSDEALKLLVRYMCRKLKLRTVGFTGTTGKTTTRGMLAEIFKLHGPMMNSKGSINTLWGNARFVFEAKGGEWWPVEIAMDQAGEITWQAEAVEPEVTAVLNVGATHASRLGGVEGVYQAKAEMAHYAVDNQLPLILNLSDAGTKRMFDEFEGETEIITYGYAGSGADWLIADPGVDLDGTRFDLTHSSDSEFEYPITLSVYGKPYAENATAAALIARELGVDWRTIIDGLKNFAGAKGRFQRVKLLDNLTLINDAYNANPKSMDMSVRTFAELFGVGETSYLILGDMAELAEVAEQEHRKLANTIQDLGFKTMNVMYAGTHDSFHYGQKFDRQEFQQKLEDISAQAQADPGQNYAVLVKASNSYGWSLLSFR